MFILTGVISFCELNWKKALDGSKCVKHYYQTLIHPDSESTFFSYTGNYSLRSVLCSFTSQQVLHTLFTSWNHLFQHFNMFFHLFSVTNGKKEKTPKKKEKITQKGVYQLLGASFFMNRGDECRDCWLLVEHKSVMWQLLCCTNYFIRS